MKRLCVVGLLCAVWSLGISICANGAVVYSGVLNGGTGFKIDAINNWVYLDFNSMTASYSSLAHIDYVFYGDGQGPINAISGSLFGHVESNVFDYGGYLASTKAYSAGEVVDDSANWFGGPGFLSIEWSDNVPAYVGIKKSDHEGGYQFGWIEVMYTNMSQGEAVILSFAYETSGNTILAGDGGGTGYAMAGWTTLDMPGATETGASNIDGSNIVGGYTDASGGHGFLYDGTSWTTLDMPGATYTCLCGINGSNIVGEYTDTSGNEHGFLYNGTSWTTLDMPVATETHAYDISGSNIVGWYYDASGGPGGHGFLYDGTNWTTLDMPGATETSADGIDGSNIVSSYTDTSGNQHGFLYNGTSWTTLDMPGATYTWANGIDGSNIVGQYWDADGEQHGFLYDGTNWITLDMPGATETSANGINGRNIVGEYTDVSGFAHGFIYTIPEPANLADYFPLSLGSYWTYQNADNASDTYTVSVFEKFVFSGFNGQPAVKFGTDSDNYDIAYNNGSSVNIYAGPKNGITSGISIGSFTDGTFFNLFDPDNFVLLRMYDNLDPTLKSVYGVTEPNLVLWVVYDSDYPKNSQNSIVESNLGIALPDYAVTGLEWYAQGIGEIVDLDIDAASGDIGARYELISYNIVPEPICTQKPAGDLNFDCKVDLEDFALFANSWLECNLDPPSECWE